jgi:sec-independent protein translocase protein TatB
MFDVGFSELVMVGLVSLLVIGPERLPKVARLAGFWIGKARNMAAVVKAEIAQELHEEEFRQALREHAALDELETIMQETAESVSSIKVSLEKQPAHIEVTEPNEPK